VPYLVALALTLGPLAAGLSLGIALRRLAPRMRHASVMLGLGAPFLLLALHERIPLAPWDLLVLGGAFAAALALGVASESRWQAFVVGAGAALVALLAVELLAIALPEPERFPPAAQAHLRYEQGFQSSGALDALYADDRDRQRAREETRPVVLHLGDSLVFGEGTKREERATSLLEAQEPSVAQINRGAPGTGPDVHLLVLRKWLPAVHPRLVVHHLFTGNDIDDIDADYGACDGGPVLEYTPEGPVERCPKPRWRRPLRWLVAHSPPPYALRVFASVSRVAAHACTAFSRLGSWTEPEAHASFGPTSISEQKWQHFTEIMRAERDDVARVGARLVVVVLPLRSALDAPDPRATQAFRLRTRMLGVLEALEVRVLDPWEAFETAVRRDGSKSLFIDPPAWEIHLNPRGHRFYADWLSANVDFGQAPSPPR
jgi:hypothetical protein